MSARARTRRRASVLVAFTLACLGIFLFLLDLAGGLHIDASYDFEAVVPTSVQLVPGADVREAGVDIGHVTALSNRGATAVVAVAIDKRYAPVYRDGTARIRTKTIVGENYLELVPGTPASGAVPAGGVLPISQARDAVQLDQILSTLTPPRRRRLQELLVGFGGGLHGMQGQLNQTLDALSATVNDAAPVAQALAGQSQQLATMVDNLGQVFTALGERSAEVQTLVSAGLASARAVSAQGQALQQTLRDLPPALLRAQSTTARLATVGAAATPVVDDLNGALGTLTPTMRDLPAAATATLSALDRLHALTPAAGRLLSALKGTAPVGAAAIGPLDQAVRQLRPALAYLAPYASDAAHLLEMIDSAGVGHDATGYLARIVGVVGSASLTTLTSQEKQALQALEAIGAAKFVNLKGLNAYPAPGTAATPGVLSTTYPHVRADR